MTTINEWCQNMKDENPLDSCKRCGRVITDTDDTGMEADNGQRWCIRHYLGPWTVVVEDAYGSVYFMDVVAESIGEGLARATARCLAVAIHFAETMASFKVVPGDRESVIAMSPQGWSA